MDIDKREYAVSLHNKDYNCAQAVLCAFSQEVGVPQETLLKIAEGLGGGIARSRESACGALIGAIMLAGLQKADGNVDAPATKEQTYELSMKMMKRFEEKTGAVLCKDLKGAGTGVPLCSCPDCIRFGVEVAQEFLGL